ncbi:MAG: GSCFA domain-containing protein [Flavobacteriales bacterium]|nr:GSCFA domain-containing protein [Flavobacteriales bacterium]
MHFRTQISISEYSNKIDYNSKIGCLGSCFSEHIANRFSFFKFDVVSNPFGILFSPTAIEKIITKAVYEEQFAEEDIFYLNDQWQSYDVHSCLNQLEKDNYLLDLNHRLVKLRNTIKNASHFFITYGSAWVYRLKETNQLVANCHKVPQKEFDKELLTAEAISKSIDNTVRLLQSINPDLQVIFTISPVRHLKDGFVENQRSKSNLITAVHELVNNQELLSYFPSYEIVMDELRDYRFYEEDMVHPNKLAIDYIWEQLVKVMLTKDSICLMKEVEAIQKMKSHKPFNPTSQTYTMFLENLNRRIEDLKKINPSISFE